MRDEMLGDLITRLDARLYAVLVGAAIGLAGGIIGLMVVLLGPVIAFGAVLGLCAGLYILTNVHAALYAVIGVMVLLPFGTFPFEVGFTPTLMDMAIGAFLLVYLFQWMTGRRRSLQLTPVNALIAVYMMWLILSFALGLRHSALTVTALRQFTGTLLSISMAFVLVDLLREPLALRRLVLVVIIAIGVQALIAGGLYALPDEIAESLLNRLGRLGYPVGHVIRYIEANPELPERAIGTWVDPNALGGVLAVSAAIIAPQMFAQRSVLRYRWLTFAVLALVVLVLFLTFSRASMLALAIGLCVIALVRYRRFLPLLLITAILLLFLPQTQAYIERFADAFRGEDLATQMRLGEYRDSLRLISRYPVTGVGFTGTPEIDIYTDVASMYLIMANQIGLVGAGIFLTTITCVFAYGIFTWRLARRDELLDSIHLGFHASLLTALANAVADLYFFRLDFQASITLFWLIVALSLASSRLALAQLDNQSTGL